MHGNFKMENGNSEWFGYGYGYGVNGDLCVGAEHLS